MLLAKNRLKDSKDFQKVFKNGRFLHSRLFTLHYLPNNQRNIRLGFVISSKTAPKAYQRNKIKRRFRAIFRLILAKKCQEIGQFCHGHDMIVVARKIAVDVDYKELQKEVIRLLIKAKLAK